MESLHDASAAQLRDRSLTPEQIVAAAAMADGRAPAGDQCDSDDSQDLDRLTLEGFELLENNQEHSLGKGSFGVVQKIRKKGSRKIYALKSMRKGDVIEGNLVDQVEIEIKVQRNLKHRNVVRLYRHFEDTDMVYLLLEYCAKGELYQILRTQKCRRFSEAVACNYFVQAAEGLIYLHNKNVVHRDIKPENLLVNHDDVLKIADFGWCAVSSTLRTTFCGTLDYLAPEMIQGKGHDHTLDVWSAGVLLYEMVVGRPPFQSTNHGQLISKILKLDLAFPSVASHGLRHLVSKLLVTDPRHRLPLQEAIRDPWVLKSLQEDTGATRSTCASATSPGGTAPSEEEEKIDIVKDEMSAFKPPRERSVEPDPVVRANAEVPVAMPPAPPVTVPPSPSPQFRPEVRPRPAGDGRDAVPQSSTPAPSTPAPASYITTTPTTATRGLHSPRVPFQMPQPAAVSRPNGIVPTTAPYPVIRNMVSPTSTPNPIVPRPLQKEKPVQIVLPKSTSTAPGEPDELSRTWNTQNAMLSTLAVEPARPLGEQRAQSALRQAAYPSQDRPAFQSVAVSGASGAVVYRPLAPSGSPAGPTRALDGSTARSRGTEAPGTPVQREAFRARTLSPPTDYRVTGDLVDASKQTTAEAVRSALPRRGISKVQQGPQRREVSSRESREPSLQHASSQHALQRGAAATGGERGAANGPASPKLQTRRLSAAQPASVSDGIAGTSAVGTRRAPGGSMTAAGVLASPFPGCRVITEGGMAQTSPASMDQAPRLVEEDRHSARYTPTVVSEDPELETSAASSNSRPLAAGSRVRHAASGPAAPLSVGDPHRHAAASPTGIVGGGRVLSQASGRPVQRSALASVQTTSPPVYSQGQPRRESKSMTPLSTMQLPSGKRNVAFPPRT